VLVATFTSFDPLGRGLPLTLAAKLEVLQETQDAPTTAAEGDSSGD
jgi:hypothetical protein